MAASEQPVRTVGSAVDAFLARPDLAASSRRSYAQTLNRLAADIGADRAIAVLAADALDVAMQDAWGACAPATWNRHVATARSFVAFCRRRGWLAADVAVGVDRRREPADRTRAIPFAQLERLWRRSDVAVREKALWRLLYETAARASRSCRSTSRASSLRTSALACGPRAATSSCCIFRPARRGCCRA